MSLWELFSSLFGRKDEEVEQGLQKDVEDIEHIAFNDQDFDAFAEMGEIPPTPEPGEDEPTTDEHEAYRRHWWQVWKW
jgi:hypothetical protein